MINKTMHIKDFWKPIDQCPKERGKAYFVWAAGQNLPTIGVTWSDAGFNKFDFYAEIPPLPTNEEQNHDSQA